MALSNAIYTKLLADIPLSYVAVTLASPPSQLSCVAASVKEGAGFTVIVSKMVFVPQPVTLPACWLEVAVMVYGYTVPPGAGVAVGVPEIKPVCSFKVTPAGKPSADKVALLKVNWISSIGWP